MSDDFNSNNSYWDYLDNFSDDVTERITASDNKRRTANKRTAPNRNIKKRKGLKWKLIGLSRNRTAIIALFMAILLFVIMVLPFPTENNAADATEEISVATVVKPTSYQISGVPVLPQDDLTACCESYACTMLLQYLGFDLTINEFVENYLIKKPVYYGEDGKLYGPDMNAAFAGDIYFGYGINAPAMAKCMNNYLKENNSQLKAYDFSGVPMEEFCEKYVLNGIPVMIWATANMDEPFVHATWIVDYVDENSTVEIGDTVDWQMHEHCMVLIGFDEEYYYLSDSVAGKVAAYDKATFEDRYAKIGTQAIVVK